MRNDTTDDHRHGLAVPRNDAIPRRSSRNGAAPHQKADIVQVYPCSEGAGTETVSKTWEHLGCDGGDTKFENCRLIESCIGRSVRCIFSSIR